jgi:hypothetical protein
VLNVKGFFDENYYSAAGWLSAIPFNKGIWDSHLSLLNEDMYLFISKRNEKEYIPKIQKVIFENYNIKTEVESISTESYSLIKFFK